MALRISIVSTKGGVGKTTLTANLGGILADLGQRVLLIDADIQPTLSSYYRLTHQAPRGLIDVLESGDTTESISTTEIGCDIVLSNDAEARLPDWVLHTPDGRFRLKRIFKHSTAMISSSSIPKARSGPYRTWPPSPPMF